ncbi:hypothetical protein ES705_50702 [subsurface metagenome]
MGDQIIKAEKVTKIYKRGRSEIVRALDKVSLEINAGEIRRHHSNGFTS